MASLFGLEKNALPLRILSGQRKNLGRSDENSRLGELETWWPNRIGESWQNLPVRFVNVFPMPAFGPSERVLNMECREKRERNVESLGYIVKIQSIT